MFKKSSNLNWINIGFVLILGLCVACSSGSSNSSDTNELSPTDIAQSAATETFSAAGDLILLHPIFESITSLTPAEDNFFEVNYLGGNNSNNLTSGGTTVASQLLTAAADANLKTYIRVKYGSNTLNNSTIIINYLRSLATQLPHLTIDLVKHSKSIGDLTTEKWFGTFQEPVVLTYASDSLSFFATGPIKIVKSGGIDYTITANYKNVKLPIVGSTFDNTAINLLDGTVEMKFRYKDTDYGITVNKTNGVSKAIVNGTQYDVTIGTPTTTPNTAIEETTLNLSQAKQTLATLLNTTIEDLSLKGVYKGTDSTVLILHDGSQFIGVNLIAQNGVYVISSAKILNAPQIDKTVLINNYIYSYSSSGSVIIYDMALNTVGSFTAHLDSDEGVSKYDDKLAIIQNRTTLFNQQLKVYYKVTLYDLSSPSSPTVIGSYEIPTSALFSIDSSYYLIDSPFIADKKMMSIMAYGGADGIIKYLIRVYDLTNLNNIVETQVLTKQELYSGVNYGVLIDVFGRRNLDINSDTFIVKRPNFVDIYKASTPTSNTPIQTIANAGFFQYASDNTIALVDNAIGIKVFAKREGSSTYVLKKTINITSQEGLWTTYGVTKDEMVVLYNINGEFIISFIKI